MSARGNATVPLPPRTSTRNGASPLFTTTARAKLDADVSRFFDAPAPGAMGSYGGPDVPGNDRYVMPADKAGNEFKPRPPTMVISVSACRASAIGPDPYGTQTIRSSKGGYSLGMPVSATSWDGLHAFSRNYRRGAMSEFSGLPKHLKRRDLNLLER